MRSIELGIVLPMEEAWTDGSTPRWVEIRELALRAEAMGFDTVWIPDELLWRRADGSIHGWWESVAMTGAVAAATSRVKVGTWILSALHRNPGDHREGGRDAGRDQRRAVRLRARVRTRRQAGPCLRAARGPVIGRFEEALEIIVPCCGGPGGLRGDLPRRSRPGAATGRSAPRPHPDHDRGRRSEDAPPGRPARRHLELVRRGATAISPSSRRGWPSSKRPASRSAGTRRRSVGPRASSSSRPA